MFKQSSINHHSGEKTPPPSSMSAAISPMRLFRRKQHRRSHSELTAEEALTVASTSSSSSKSQQHLFLPELAEEAPVTTTALKPNSVLPLRLFRRKQNHHRRATSEPMSADQLACLPQQPDETDTESFHRSDLQVGRLLGEGGFACVFQVKVKSNGKHAKPKNKLALKQLRQELLQDKDLFATAANALVQEASIMKQLRGHKNILTLRGVSGDADQPMPNKRGFDAFFLLTDALKETMADRLTKWSKSARSASSTPAQRQERWMYQLNYSLQIAQALAYCHEQRIIFRDCKCDNIGFSDEHTIQLFDFGMARALPSNDNEEDSDDDCQTVTSSLDSLHGEDDVFRMTICGTQRWMAPEVYNRGWYSTKADVYSWSMTAVELLTHKKPHSYMSLPVHKVLVLEGGGRPAVSNFPVGLQLILQQAWAHNVADRWSMAQVCAALQAYIGSECSQQQASTTDSSKGRDAPLLQDQARNNNLKDIQNQPNAKTNALLTAKAA